MSDGGDAALWARALRGDDQAFGALFEQHHPRVFRHALHLVALPAEADDVAAAAFFELWRRRAAVRLVDESVLPWLLATTTYVARNRLRSSARYGRMLARLPHDPDVDAAETAAERIEAAERRRRIAQALRQVSAADAALVTLTAIDGLPVADAAIAVGVAPSAARMRLSRARARLRGLLADLQAPSPDQVLSERTGR